MPHDATCWTLSYRYRRSLPLSSHSMLRHALLATSISLRPVPRFAMATAAPAPLWPVLDAAAAARLDAELMASPGFSLDQLMELAGLSVACALAEVYPPSTHPRVLIVAGPGNNGGDGLVAARHLVHFGYSPRVVLPRRRAGDAGVANLLAQLEMLGVVVLPDMPVAEAILKVGGADSADVALDAIFGFSFSGPPREPLAGALRTLAAVSEQQQEHRESNGKLDPGNCSSINSATAGAAGTVLITAASAVAPICRSKAGGIPVVSVDVPSGWAVDGGDTEEATTLRLLPSMLVSLTGEPWEVPTSFPACLIAPRPPLQLPSPARSPSAGRTTTLVAAFCPPPWPRGTGWRIFRAFLAPHSACGCWDD